MISTVHAYGRVARAEQLLLPVLLGYVLLPGLRYITVAILAHCRRLRMHRQRALTLIWCLVEMGVTVGSWVY